MHIHWNERESLLLPLYCVTIGQRLHTQPEPLTPEGAGHKYSATPKPMQIARSFMFAPHLKGAGVAGVDAAAFTTWSGLRATTRDASCGSNGAALIPLYPTCWAERRDPGLPTRTATLRGADAGAFNRPARWHCSAAILADGRSKFITQLHQCATPMAVIV